MNRVDEYVRVKNRLEEEIAKMRRKIENVRKYALDCNLPENLRPATPRDIVVDAIIWVPDIDEEFAYWHLIEEVYSPSDPYKGYCAGGCRYGLDGAFVEDKDD